MNYKEEIAYREKIMGKEKITPEERDWLMTHTLYNSLLGYPFICKSMEKVEPNKWYLLKINVESVRYEDEIAPVITVPGTGKKTGKIIADFEVVDRKGNVSVGKPIKMLELSECKSGMSYQVKYLSERGLLAAYYGCHYFDHVSNIYTGDFSSSYMGLAMIREPVNEHKIRYRCKSPRSDSFDAMVFTVEWTEIGDESTDSCRKSAEQDRSAT